jgi:hypothetical protein
VHHESWHQEGQSFLTTVNEITFFVCTDTPVNVFPLPHHSSTIPYFAKVQQHFVITVTVATAITSMGRWPLLQCLSPPPPSAMIIPSVLWVMTKNSE